MTKNLEHPFPNLECPCGASQEDPERLYCDDCIDYMVQQEVKASA